MSNMAQTIETKKMPYIDASTIGAPVLVVVSQEDADHFGISSGVWAATICDKDLALASLDHAIPDVPFYCVPLRIQVNGAVIHTIAGDDLVFDADDPVDVQAAVDLAVEKGIMRRVYQ